MIEQQCLDRFAQSRDAEAFRVLVDQYQRLVYSAASRRLGNSHDIEDVVQSTFLKLATAAGTIRHDLSSWLYSTTINTANDLIRRDQSRRRRETLSATPESVNEDAERAEWNKLSLIIDQVLLELPEPRRSLIVEHFLRGRSQRDLAEEMRVSQPTVLRRINAAVDEVREKLARLGYTTAAPVLAAMLERIPQPAVPASVTVELAKIGLAGAPSASVGASGAFAGSPMMKFGLIAAVLAALLAGAFALLTAPGPKPVSAAPASAPATPTIDPKDWRAAFNNSYALALGQNLKFIPPPPLPERQRYLHEVDHNDTPMPFIQWRWINGGIKRQWMSAAGPAGVNLYSVLGFCAKLDQHHVVLVGLPPLNCDGDWIVRDGASTDAILSDLKKILLQHYRLELRYEKDEVVKEALVVTGKYQRHTLPEATSGEIQIFAGIMDHPKPNESCAGGGTDKPAEFWTEMGAVVGLPVVDESINEPSQLSWAFSYSSQNAGADPGRRDQVVSNLAKQTDLVFKREKRSFITWMLGAVPGREAPYVRPDGALPPVTLPEIANNTPGYQETARRMRRLIGGLGSYMNSHQRQLPPDLAAITSALKGDDVAACFLTPADQVRTEIPAAITAEWVRQHTSFVYLAGNVDLRKLTSANADFESIIVLHTKVDQPLTAPRMGKVIVAFRMRGEDLIPVADAPAAIAKSLKMLDVARAPATTQP